MEESNDSIKKSSSKEEEALKNVSINIDKKDPINSINKDSADNSANSFNQVSLNLSFKSSDLQPCHP